MYISFPGYSMDESEHKASRIDERKFTEMMPRVPGAYDLVTKTPIFVPTDQPDISSYGGKNKKSKNKVPVYTDTSLY